MHGSFPSGLVRRLAMLYDFINWSRGGGGVPMLTRIACLAVVITTFLIAAGQADNPDKFKPPQLAGDQPPSNDKPACQGKFHIRWTSRTALATSR